MKLEYYGATEQGRRPRNEDSFIIFRNSFGYLVAVVADGMGGHKGGNVASKSVAKLTKKALKDVNFGIMTPQEIERFLLTTIREFQKELKRIGYEFPELSDMGTTLNLNVFVPNKVYTINVGDSRTQSFINKDIERISIDHNLATLAENNPDYAHYAGQTNLLTSSLGPNKQTTADAFVVELEAKKGYILMSTDGVHNSISEIALIKIIKSSKTIEEKVNEVIKTAFDNGSNDNMTFVLIKYEL